MSDDLKEQTASLKLIIVGPVKVGKTSLLCALDNKDISDLLSSISVSYLPKVIDVNDKGPVTLEIWDTAGQEIYQSICKAFYVNANIAFICFEASAVETIEKWISQVRNIVPQCLIYLVCTKIDLLDENAQKLIRDEEQAMLNKYEAQQFFMTSSLNNVGVKELFYSAAAEYFSDKILKSEVNTININTEEKNSEKKSDQCSC